MDKFGKNNLLDTPHTKNYESHDFLVHLSTKCSRWAVVITLCLASVERRQQFLQMTSPPRPMDRFQNNYTEMFLWWPSIIIAKIVPLRWTKWPPELKIEKPLNDTHFLLGQWFDFKIISQKCYLGDPLPKLLKWLRSAKQNDHQS